MEEKLIAKYQAIIDNLKDGKSVKITRNTVLIGKPKPYGTLTREGNMIKFVPAKRVPDYSATWLDTKAAKELVDRELISAFSF